MVCIYCGQATEVTNSRLNKKLNRVWRRRQCATCQGIFTTHETAQLTTSLVIENNQKLIPFSRDHLFISIYQSCAHRSTAINDATALTDTIVAKLTHSHGHQGKIPIHALRKVTTETLQHFDKVAATYYGAYHHG